MEEINLFQSIFLYVHQFFSRNEGAVLGFLFFISKLIFLYVMFVFLLQGLLSFLPQSIKELTGGRESKLFILPFVIVIWNFKIVFLLFLFWFSTKLFHLIFGEGKRPQGFMSFIRSFFTC